MFFVRATGVDARITTVCTEEAEGAIAHLQRMERSGLRPTVTDWAGRTVNIIDLKRQADTNKAALQAAQ